MINLVPIPWKKLALFSENYVSLEVLGAITEKIKPAKNVQYKDCFIKFIKFIRIFENTLIQPSYGYYCGRPEILFYT